MIKVTKYQSEYKELFLSGISDLPILKRKEIEENINNIKDNEEFLVCIDDNNNFVGFSKTTMRTKGFVVLDYIFVKENLRRDKNGSVILVAVTTRAVNKLNVAVVTECKKDNTVALAFLKARNFVVTQEDDNVCYLSRSLLPMYKTHN